MTSCSATASTAGIAIMLIAFTAAWNHAPLLIWNATASVPIGLYAVQDAGPLAVGELVLVQPTERVAEILADGGYLPNGIPLIKYVAALPGSIVCRDALTIRIDGIVRAQAQEQDHAGRTLPSWSGCRAVADNQVFLLNATEPASLDGRYFGPLPSEGIIGQAVPLWTERRP